MGVVVKLQVFTWQKCILVASILMGGCACEILPVACAIGLHRDSSSARHTVDTVYVAVYDTVFNEHAGFGISTSVDGVSWNDGMDVAVEGGAYFLRVL